MTALERSRVLTEAAEHIERGRRTLKEAGFEEWDALLDLQLGEIRADAQVAQEEAEDDAKSE